ncbi:MAG: hypothetical protein V1798_01410 [Pseudomonadota bacterium]
MDNLLSRWASLGMYVVGDIDPLEDPELLIMDSVAHMESDGRLLEIVTSWLARYGHLLLTKKLYFETTRERRLFSAIIEASKSNEGKLRRLIVKGRVPKTEHLYPNLPKVLKDLIEKDPDPAFLRHGFLLARGERIREGVVLPPRGVYERSLILRYRALHGPTLRSDVQAVLPDAGAISLHELARRLHVAASSLHPIIRDYVRSGLVERLHRAGPGARFRWVGPEERKAA